MLYTQNARTSNPQRCWQSTLERAATICSRNHDCVAIVHAKNGYEPRRAGHATGTAMERWTITHA